MSLQGRSQGLLVGQSRQMPALGSVRDYHKIRWGLVEQVLDIGLYPPTPCLHPPGILLYRAAEREREWEVHIFIELDSWTFDL